MNIKRELKKQARELLPDQEFKTRVQASVVPETNQKKASSEKNKKRIGAFASAMAFCATILIVALTLVFALPSGNGTIIENLNTDNYISIEVNPKFEIIADKENIVKNVNALNKDAMLVIYGKDFNGLKVEDVCNNLLESAKKLNMINGNEPIKIVAYNKDRNIEANLQQNIKTTIDTYLKINNITKTVEIVKSEIADDTKSATRIALENEAIKLGMSPEEASKLEISELMRKVSGFDEKSIIDTLLKIDSKISSNLDLKSLKAKLQQYELLEDLLEDAIDFFEDGELNKFRDKIAKYNEKCDELSLQNIKFGNFEDAKDIKQALQCLEYKVEKLGSIDLMEDSLEDALEYIESEDIDNLKSAIEQYNSECVRLSFPENMQYEGSLEDLTILKQFLEDKKTELEKYDDLEDLFEDILEQEKLIWKDEIIGD